MNNSKMLGRFVELGTLLVTALIPLMIGITALNAWHWNLSVPFVYLQRGGDETWQLILTKALIDNGWILNNPYLGAPGHAHWYDNPAGQASAMHSILMLALSKIIKNPVEVQQIYYIGNFSLISICTFISCRLLAIGRLPAMLVAMLSSLLTYRFNFIIYSFLGNYFCVPLALVPVYWIFVGRFAIFSQNIGKSNLLVLRHIFSSKHFLLGLTFIILIAMADGYYAFFTLLLLGFAIGIRLLAGDFKQPVLLVAPLVYCVVLVTVALSLVAPITIYKHTHAAEFSPNGVEDPVLVRHAFEAEIYSVSLKLLIAPSPNDRIRPLGKLGKKMIETSEIARQYKIGVPNVQLGILGSGLFMAVLIVFLAPALRERLGVAATAEPTAKLDSIAWASGSFAIFIFLCSISGGIGTLVALVYPTIRAYDRFPLFLVFVLYIGGAAIATMLLDTAQPRRRRILVVFFVLLTVGSLYDQIPNNSAKGDQETEKRFLAERHFVSEIEHKLPQGAMVYEYPYSRWLSNSPYYGWGSFGQIRLYLHSHFIRWSNGASKNSPVDNWHASLSALPVDDLITEIRAAGFAAFVVDRTVVKPDEYKKIRDALLRVSREQPIEDNNSHLAFFQLKDLAYRLHFDNAYDSADGIVVTDAKGVLESADMSRYINRDALISFLKESKRNSETISRATNPEIFRSTARMFRGDGSRPISPISDVKGDFQCVVGGKSDHNDGGMLFLDIENRSDFDWFLDQGAHPLRIGVHFKAQNGQILSWDTGYRVPLGNEKSDSSSGGRPRMVVPAGASRQIAIPTEQLFAALPAGGTHEAVAEIRLVQDGVAWIDGVGCDVKLKR
ncbi:hypothetical protein QYH69_12545 [Paraburkholderia sp. SARCC-3016]|uniref:hypothetical protein n=1 Tax=Paraburkholderia sp. SARCC-3016 TaxID=3058611 RepID=UPI0028078F9B|nr:hypothetical protein [Paraburkholderia sp. SARCC-3016]MDQ7978071.1 hypothetical protein [Paraburkholderia sp. SARCC-3016]